MPYIKAELTVCTVYLKGYKNMEPEKKYETSSIDDIKALFEKRTDDNIIPLDELDGKFKPKPAATTVKASSSQYPKRKTTAQKKRNRLIANIMIYSGIALLIIMCAILVTLIFTGNNGDSIKGLEITNSGDITLRIGHSEKLKVKTEPSDTEYALSYVSADTSVATVSLDGKITGVSDGKTEITVSSGELSDSIIVIVKKDIIEKLDVSLAALSLDGGEEQKVTAKLTPSDAKDVSLSWKSADTEVATVDKDGNIKGVNTGETIVTVTDSVTGLSKDISVTVNGLELPDSMEGVITAKSEGSCTIEAYYENDFRLVATMEVNIIDPYVITQPETTVPETPKPETSKPSAPSYNGSHKMEVIDGITYFDGVMIANKTYTLPASYNPGVQPVAMDAFYDMQAAAAADGISLWILSSFRSYEDQDVIYNRYVAQDGRDAADTYSSRPGHSDHQTGYTFDLNSLEQDFQYDPAGKWLDKNCYKYGFIIRYPKGKESSTGYMYEPWHVRYIGVDLATKVTQSGLSLEEYFGITSQYQD